MALNLTVFDIIKGPVVSEKANELNQQFKKLVLEVHPQANKIQIKQALQTIFSVKVDKINTLRRKGKIRRMRRIFVQGSTTKRVIVTLQKGYEINLFDQKSSLSSSNSN